MAVFQYRALDQGGREASGEIEALSRSDALDALTRRGETPFRLSAQAGTWWERLNRPVRLGEKVTKADVLRVTQEVARLLEAGIALERALSILHGTRRRKPVRELLARLLERVRAGKSLSEALGGEPKVFPLFYLQIVHAGELSGRLEDSFTRLAALLSRRHAFRSSLLSAMIYPALLMVLVAVTLVVVIGVVLPEFESLFAGAGAALPLPTRIVIGIGGFFHDFGWWLLLGIIGGVAILWRRLKNPQVRLKADSFLVQMRWTGRYLVKAEMALGLRNLGSMIQNGVPLSSAFAMVAGTFRNTAIRRDFTEAASVLKGGAALSRVFTGMPWFPGTALQMVRVGEETGKLGAMLEEAATLLENDVEVATKRFLAVFSPALTLLMGGLIAAIIGAVLLGIMGINELAL